VDGATVGYGALALVLLGVTWALAAVVRFSGLGRLQNLSLALFIFLEGTNSALFDFTAILRDQRSAFALAAVQFSMLVAIPPIYLVFLSTIDSPLSRPFRPAGVRIALVAVALAAAAHVILFTRTDLPGFRPTGSLGWTTDPSPMQIAMTLAYSLLNLFSLAVSITAFRATAPGSAARQTIKAYLRAFVIFDVAVFASFASFYVVDDPQDLIDLVGFPVIDLVFLSLLGYGILRSQLFDIDLKVKFAIKGSTLGAVFVVAFLIVSQLVQNLTTQTFGVVSGAVAAGLLLFALRPLERLATRVADKAMPRTQDSDSYRDFRKMEVYKATAESFHHDGRITSRERDALSRLAAKLGIAAADARAIEADLQG
jgi:hypothetical protein